MDGFDEIRNNGQTTAFNGLTPMMPSGQTTPTQQAQSMSSMQQFPGANTVYPSPQAPVMPPLPTQMSTGSGYGAPKKSGGKTALWIVLAVVLALLIAGGACYYFLVIAKQCALGGCNSERASGSQYCEQHTCDVDGCYELAEDGKYCDDHQEEMDKEEEEALGELVSFGWNSEYWNLRFELPPDTKFDESSDEEGVLFEFSTESKTAKNVTNKEKVVLCVEKTEDSAKSYLKEYNEDGEFVIDSITFCDKKWTRLSNGKDEGKALYKDGVWLARKEGDFVCMIYYYGSVDETSYVTPCPLLDGCFSAYDDKPDQACLTTKPTTTTKAPTTTTKPAAPVSGALMYDKKITGYAIIGSDKNNLRIRTGPGTNYRQLDGGPSKQKTYFGKDDKIAIVGEAIDTNGDLWYVVDYPWEMTTGEKGRYAYVYAAYVSFTNP